MIHIFFCQLLKVKKVFLQLRFVHIVAFVRA